MIMNAEKMTDEMCYCGHPFSEHREADKRYNTNVACYHKDGLLFCNCGDFMSVKTYKEMQEKLKKEGRRGKNENDN